MLDSGFPVPSMVSDHPLQAGLVTPRRSLLWALLSAVECDSGKFHESQNGSIFPNGQDPLAYSAASLYSPKDFGG